MAGAPWDRKTDLPKLIVSILICLGAGVAGSVFTTPRIPAWYAGLAKPALTPPSWVFGPVWTTLFLLMGIALFLVWREGLESPEVRQGVLLFALQLFFNVAWSGLFFGLQSPAAGLAGIVILWALIVATLLRFWKISRTAGALLIPYLLWVTIAANLNYGIMVLNP
jgi:tryptophan-rich sensory protein